jgi:hypothetical protein
MDFDLLTIGVVVVTFGLGLVWYFNRKSGLDVNQDGKVDVADAKAAVANTVVAVEAKVEAAADLNKDGKVSVADAEVAVVAVKKAATRVKKTATKAVAKKTTRKASGTV